MVIAADHRPAVQNLFQPRGLHWRRGPPTRPEDLNVSELIVIAVAIFVTCLGAFGLTSPAAMVSFVSSWPSKGGLWAAAAIRLAFGVALWGAAAASLFPAVFKILSAVSVFSAVSLPLMGVSRFTPLLAWWSRRSPAFVRAWSAAALLMGVFLLWAMAA
jgi:hypothetical protein